MGGMGGSGELGKAAGETLAQLQPVFETLHEEGIMDDNGYGAPLLLAAIGNARDLVDKLLEWDKEGKLKNQEFRQFIGKMSSINNTAFFQNEPDGS